MSNLRPIRSKELTDISDKWAPATKDKKYLVSVEGYIYNTVKDCIVKGSITSGFKVVSMNGSTYRVHRLVAEAFIPNPHKLHYVRHIDNNPLNDRVENLRWVESLDKVDTKPKLDAVKVARIKWLLGYGKPRKAIAEEYGVGISTINSIAIGSSWKSVIAATEAFLFEPERR